MLYSFNAEAFDKPLSEGAFYWLGFLAGDGSVQENRCSKVIILKLASIDKSHLDLFANFLGFDGWVEPDGNAFRLRIYSVLLASKLSRFGIVPNKTFTVKAADELVDNRHFWRGFADADGTLGLSYNKRDRNFRPFFGFTKGSYHIIRQASNYVRKTFGFIKQMRDTGKCWRVDYRDSEAKAMIYHLYHDCSVALERKLDKAREIVRL